MKTKTVVPASIIPKGVLLSMPIVEGVRGKGKHMHRHVVMGHVPVSNQPVMFKSSLHTEWQPWLYMPPSKGTLAILLSEQEGTAKQRASEPLLKHLYGEWVPHVLFMGERVYAFRWRDGQVWDCKHGFNSPLNPKKAA